jgi:hypothetical protein
MDYQKIYDSFMASRLNLKGERKILKKSGSYFERHHITPISLGGDRSYAIGSNNIVLLTAREHYIAHRLLWLIHGTREMGFAFHKMVFSDSPLQERRFDSRAYEAAKLALSQCQRGENNPMWGKKTWKEGMIHPSKGKKFPSRPHLIGINNPASSVETRNKISKALKGKTRDKIKGAKNNNHKGNKILLENGEILGTFENLEDIVPIVNCTIHNLKNHINKRCGSKIRGKYSIWYEEDYKKSLD